MAATAYTLNEIIDDVGVPRAQLLAAIQAGDVGVLQDGTLETCMVDIGELLPWLADSDEPWSTTARVVLMKGKS